MKNIFLSLSGLAVCISFSISCDRSDSKKSPAPVVTPSPTPTQTPTFSITYAQPSPGFNYEDLLKQAYCTLTLANGETYLASEVYAYSDAMTANGASVSYYYMKDGELKQSAQVLITQVTSNCDLASLKEVPALSLLRSPIEVYADANLEGEPICSFAPGSTRFSDMDIVLSGGVQLMLKEQDCKGQKIGFLKEHPAFIYLYRSVTP